MRSTRAATYILSQKHEGWSVARERYDDGGGFSGGSMERPGRKALLADIAAGKIDVVVTYKIDRLTRSLADFARIIEVFEKHGASFVSVTQSFNTKTSMGRLMLHVLLSLAQFERAQAILASRSTEEMHRPKLASSSLMQGLIFDRHGRKMGPAHTRRSGQRFRYYVAHAKWIEQDGPAAYRIAAEPIEHHCLAILAEHQAGQVRSIDEAANAASLARSAADKRQLVCDHVRRVTIGDAELTLEFKDGAIAQRSLERVRPGNDAKLIVGSLSPDGRARRQSAAHCASAGCGSCADPCLAKSKLSLDALATSSGDHPSASSV
jgi:DNA invertase Pin-like site-specific DNA recombinase